MTFEKFFHFQASFVRKLWQPLRIAFRLVREIKSFLLEKFKVADTVYNRRGLQL